MRVPRNRTTIPVLAAFALVILCLAGCRAPNPSALDEAVGAIARSQAVDETTVRSALQQAAASEDEQLRLAQSWRSQLPARKIPNLYLMLDDLAKFGREQLRSSTCAALFEMARTGQAPSGQQFVDQYVSDAVLNTVPQNEVLSLVQTFEALWQEAATGTLSSTDVRLTLMSIQYC